ncbi:MAG: shikimate dehydrogenase [Chloroflexota bacterium]|nr:shikimate dehydrogenase [Chloroflexota bacterium]
MLELPTRIAYHKIIQTGRMAERLGADILGLGAFTSVVGDGGITVAKSLDMPVTTGDAYTVAMAVQAIRAAASVMGISLSEATAAVVGATGAIGKICSEILAQDVAVLYLIGKTPEKLDQLHEKLREHAHANLIKSTDARDVKNAQLILTVSSAAHAIIHPEYLRPGSVICDVARPRDVSAQVASARDDVLVIDGGVVEVPGQVDFNFDFGFPPGKAYACMAETMALTLEGRFENYTLGKDITIQQVDEIEQMAKKHGFRLSGFRSFEKPVTQKQIEQVRKHAAKKFG